jgi:hypothetical protein
MSEALRTEPLPVDIRDELRAAHRHRQEAQQHYENMRHAERRGAALLSDAEHELAEIEQQSSAETAQAAAKIAADVAAGNPPAPMAPRPPGWYERREIARDRVVAAQAASRQLEAGVAAAAQAVASAVAKQQRAVAGLLVARGETLAMEVTAAESLALHLRDELAALGRTFLATDGPGRPQLIRLGLKATKVFNSRPVNDPDRQKPGGIDLLAPVAQRWRDAATALMSDPKAPLPGVED